MKAWRRKKKEEQVYSGDICITARELVQADGKRHSRLLSLVVLSALLFLATAGSAGIIISAFPISYIAPMFYPVLLIFCFFWAGFSKLKAEGVYRFLALLVVLITFSVLLLILQSMIIPGYMETANCIMASMNEVYDGNLAMYKVAENPIHITLFLTAMSFLAAGVISAGLMYRPNVWALMAVMFPLFMCVSLAGGSPGTVSMVLVLISLIGTVTASTLKDPPTFWKEGGEEQFRQNMDCYESIRNKIVVFIIVLVVTMAVPAFFLLKPGLMPPLKVAREHSMKTENGLLQAVWKFLPNVSGGRLKLSLVGVGGGVDDGTLGDSDGYYFGKIKALKLIAPERPDETIYLKGYVGSVYSGSRFGAADGEFFKAASDNWKTQDDPGLYIQNLPFLRMMYSENVTFSGSDKNATPELAGEVESTARELTVENLNANDDYTYLPYNAFLNEYYVMLAGDGAVEGQKRQEDIFSYYPLKTYREAMEEWMEHEEYHSVLDNAFTSYGNYVKAAYLQLPEEGLERLREECEATELKEIDEIRSYIVSFLSENYEFNRNTKSTPEGEDFVSYFLYEKGEGNSSHFAAAAAVMFRMFGIPSRYVVGYVAPKGIFSRQSDGTFTAILEDDNAHAWAEIFISGVGWVPVETTPGFVALLEEADYEGPNGGTQSTSDQPKDTEDKETTPEAAEEESAAGEEKEKPPLEIWMILLLIVGVLLANALLILIIHRRYLLRRRLGKLSRNDAKENMKYIYKSFYEMLLFDGWQADIGCSNDVFPEEIAKKYKDLSKEQMESLSEMILKAHYGYQEQGKKELKFVRSAYIKLGKAVYKRQRLKKKLQFRLVRCYL